MKKGQSITVDDPLQASEVAIERFFERTEADVHNAETRKPRHVAVRMARNEGEG